MELYKTATGPVPAARPRDSDLAISGSAAKPATHSPMLPSIRGNGGSRSAAAPDLESPKPNVCWGIHQSFAESHLYAPAHGIYCVNWNEPFPMTGTPPVVPAPATMTEAGRQFLQALASEADESGCFLELGPLFGSSTQAIASGRRSSATIHTIDTFHPDHWVMRRLGRNLSREAFDEYTRHIPNLVVHEGFAPDVVRDTWSEPIGCYFDDATHGDPGWSDNFNFFSRFFTHDAIICGDDFAGGWPDIPRNVTRIADTWGVGLYVLGRLWAITRGDESRIVRAAERVDPALSGATVESVHRAEIDTKPAMCWSRGLHQRIPLASFRCAGGVVDDICFATYASDGTRIAASEPGGWVDLGGVASIEMIGPRQVGFQLCLAGSKRTSNTKVIKAGERFELPASSFVVAFRFASVRSRAQTGS